MPGAIAFLLILPPEVVATSNALAVTAGQYLFGKVCLGRGA